MLEEHTERLLALPGVVGTAIGEHGGDTCIAVLVTGAAPPLDDLIPAELDGHPVAVRTTGELRALHA